MRATGGNRLRRVRCCPAFLGAALTAAGVAALPVAAGAPVLAAGHPAVRGGSLVAIAAQSSSLSVAEVGSATRQATVQQPATQRVDTSAAGPAAPVSTALSSATLAPADYSGPYGAPLIAGCAWATWVTDCSNLTVYGNGSSFDDTGCGPPNGCTFGPEFQCTELAQRYAHYAFGEPDTWDRYSDGDAYTFWAAGPLLPVPLQQFPNGGGVLPQAGDVMVFAPGWLGSYWDAPGHVAVVTGVNPAQGYVSIVEENGSRTGANNLTLSGSTVSGTGYTPVMGWLRDTGINQSQQLVASGVTGNPQAVSIASGESQVFWRGADGRLAAVFDSNSNVSRLWNAAMPANMASDPAAAALPDGSVDVFWQSTAGELWMAGNATGNWQAEDLGITGVASVPEATVGPGGAVALAWRSGDGTVWTTQIAGAARTVPRSIGASNPGGTAYPVYLDGRTLAVFWRGTDLNLWWDLETGGAWQGARSLGEGPLASDPRPVASQPGSIDVFWLGADTRAYEVSYTGEWGTTAAISNPGVTAAPNAFASGGGAVSAYLRWATGNLAIATFDPATGWLGPSLLGDGPLASVPAIATNTGSINVFWQGPGGSLWQAGAW